MVRASFFDSTLVWFKNGANERPALQMCVSFPEFESEESTDGAGALPRCHTSLVQKWCE